MADGALRCLDAVRAAVRAYRDAGADEVLLDATVAGPPQVDLRAQVVPG